MLRRLRHRAGLTQEQLAKAAGLSPRAVRALERGERQHPYPQTIHALAAALGLTSQERTNLQTAVPSRVPRRQLPVAPSGLIGREKEIQAVVDLLTSDKTRLLTLTGPGGVGKTRLALAAAEELTTCFADGVVFVSLAQLHDAALVVPTIARSLDLRGGGTQPLQEVLHSYLRTRKVLLVLDNIEHLLAGVQQVAAMLAAAPRLGVLATSRSPLRVRGEQVYQVLPLALRRAAELFVERARQAAPEVPEADAQVVAEICRRLDGLPLAIELAAARVRILPSAALLSRLDQVLSVLAEGARDLPVRQQTLRATFSWSYDLLNSAEQALFRRLAVFAGGWTLEAAAAVGEVDHATALTLHTGLLDGSLITREMGGGEPRFGFLDTIRSYAAEKLEENGEVEAARTRHTAYYSHNLALVGWTDPLGHAQPEWLDRIECEHDNLRAVLRRLLDCGEFEDLATMCILLQMFWLIRDHFTESQAWADEALAYDGLLSASACAKLLLVGASTLYARGCYDEAKARYDQAALLARQAGNLHVLTWVVVMCAYVVVWQGYPKRAIEFLDESETLAHKLGTLTHELGDSMATHAIIARAQAAIALGRPAEADQLLTQRIGKIRDQDPWSLSVALTFNGFAALLLGDYARAEDLLRESLIILGRIQNTWMMMPGLTLLASAAAQRSAAQRAARLFGVTDAIIERTGASIPPIFDELAERGRIVARNQLGSVTFEVLHQRGRELRLREVMALVIGI